MEKQFIQLLIQNKLVTLQQIQECIKIKQEMSGMGLKDKIWSILVEKKYISLQDASKFLKILENSSKDSTKNSAGLTYLSSSPQISTGKFQPPSIPRYQILKFLGKGAMGAVYLALQESLNRKVAIKFLPPKWTLKKEVVDRLKTEAFALASLNHPHIVSAIDFGVEKNNYFLVMEYVDGKPLDSILAQKIFSEKETLFLGIAMAKALIHASHHGVIHRDIKPANIMMNQKGIPKLCDLGLAKKEDEERGMTRSGDTMGTPAYMSPEQVKGIKDIDGRSDIYSLGATLFHLLTGVFPYDEGGAGKIFHQILNSPTPNPKEYNSSISTGFAKILMKMMAKDREDRYQNSVELLETLEKQQSFLRIFSHLKPIHMGILASLLLLFSIGLFFLKGTSKKTITKKQMVKKKYPKILPPKIKKKILLPSSKKNPKKTTTFQPIWKKKFSHAFQKNQNLYAYRQSLLDMYEIVPKSSLERYLLDRKLVEFFSKNRQISLFWIQPKINQYSFLKKLKHFKILKGKNTYLIRGKKLKKEQVYFEMFFFAEKNIQYKFWIASKSKNKAHLSLHFSDSFFGQIGDPQGYHINILANSSSFSYGFIRYQDKNISIPIDKISFQRSGWHRAKIELISKETIEIVRILLIGNPKVIRNPSIRKFANFFNLSKKGPQ